MSDDDGREQEKANDRIAIVPRCGALLKISHLHKRCGEWIAIGDVSFTVAAGEFLPCSGRADAASFDAALHCRPGNEPKSGEINIGGLAVYSSAEGIQVPANQRDIAMVF